MSIQIIKPSLLSSLQDRGRYGYGEYGIARSGAMDIKSLKIANLLLGNPIYEAGIELCWIGGEYVFLHSHFFVLGGADFNARLNDTPLQTCCVYQAKSGDNLILDSVKKGFRGYLCVAGGFDVESILGSKSSDTKSKIGLFGGRFFQANDILPAHTQHKIASLRSCNNPVLSYKYPPQIRVVLGPETDYFAQENIDIFLNTIYKVGKNSNRMGISTVSDSPITCKKKPDIISSGVVFGSIQIPGSGFPLILMADRQTTGGYARIATVITADLSILAQLQLGQEFSFKAISIQEAHSIYLQEEQTLESLQF